MQFLESEWWPNDFEGQGQWPPFPIIAERILRCIFGANLVILAQIHYKLSRRQAKFPRILSQNGQNDLEDQGQWPPFSIPAESTPGCAFGANLVILAPICDELLSRQAKFPRFLSQNGQNALEGQGQWPPISIPGQSIPVCMFGANLVNLAPIYDELLHGQAKFPRILSHNGQNDLEDQGQWPPFSIPAESIPGRMFGTNLVIPAQTCDELWCGQCKVYGRTDMTDGRTDGQTQATAIPLRPERPRSKNQFMVCKWNPVNFIEYFIDLILNTYNVVWTSVTSGLHCGGGSSTVTNSV